MEPLLDDWVPRTIEEAEQSIAQCKTKRQKMLDSLHIEELTAEGKIIDEQMSLSFSMLRDNPEFNSTLAVVQKLVDQISSIKNKLDILWNSYYMRLETNLKKLKFEKDTEQVREVTDNQVNLMSMPPSSPSPPLFLHLPPPTLIPDSGVVCGVCR